MPNNERPASAKEAFERANTERRSLVYWASTSSGRIEFALMLEDAQSGGHAGRCDDDIAALRDVPYIKEQLDGIDPTLLAGELREFGAWDDVELSDHDANLARALWSFCNDIVEEHGRD